MISPLIDFYSELESITNTKECETSEKHKPEAQDLGQMSEATKMTTEGRHSSEVVKPEDVCRFNSSSRVIRETVNVKEHFSDSEENQVREPSEARNSIFSSLENIKSSLGTSTTFDKIASEVISSTIMSLERVLRKATFSCANTQNDQSRRFHLKHATNKDDVGTSDGGDDNNSKVSCECCAIDGQNQIGECTSEDAPLHTPPSSSKHCQPVDKIFEMKKKDCHLEPKKKVHSTKKRFQFAVYNPDGDQECEAVKNYMVRAGGLLLDTSNTNILENMKGEIRVFIRRKHISSVHRVANLYRLRKISTVKFALFNTLSDVTEKSRAYETIFPAGGVVIPDDTVLSNSSPVEVAALFLFMKDLSCTHRKFVWVMHISRRAYKKIVPVRPATLEDSQTMDLVRGYRTAGLIHLLPKDYVAENASPTQRYLDTALKQQIEMMRQYRHFVLLTDNGERKPEEWFVARGIGVFTIREFLNTFAGEKETQMLIKRAKNQFNREVARESDSSKSSSIRGSNTGGDVVGTPQSGNQQDKHSVEGAEKKEQKTQTRNRDESKHGVNRQERAVEALPVVSSNSDKVKHCRSCLNTSSGNIKETRLEILSSLKSRREALVNKSSINKGLVTALTKPVVCEKSVTTQATLQDMTDPCMRWP